MNAYKKLILLCVLVMSSQIKGDDEGKCPICLDLIVRNDQIQPLCCNHVFHKYCIIQWAKMKLYDKSTCPVCRKSISYHRPLYLLKEHDLCSAVPYIEISITPHKYSSCELRTLQLKSNEIIQKILHEELDKKLEEEIENLTYHFMNWHIEDEDEDL